MKKFIFLFVLPLAVLAGAFYFHLLKEAERSQQEPPELGIKNGKLLPCPESPNCVSSEQQGTKSSVAPLQIPQNKNIAGLQEEIKILVLLQNGNLLVEANNYLRFEFTTPTMRYVDDFEIRIDKQNSALHFRSASRVGYGDMGANKKRYEQIYQQLEGLLDE